MRLVSTVIATVIILAVTIAVSIAVIGYVTGIFSSSSNSKPLLQVYPDCYINSSDVDNYLNPVTSLHIHLVNRGADAVISKIEVANGADIVTQFYLTDQDYTYKDAYLATRGRLSNTIPAGKEAWIIAKLEARYQPGIHVPVKIYIKSGEVFLAYCVARG